MQTTTNSNPTGSDESFAEARQLYDQMLGPIMRPALDAAEIVPGDFVLDVGCGAGGTTLEVASRIGSRGAALGIDLDSRAIDAARGRARDVAAARFVVGDAATYAFEPASFDAVVSRFGSIHFSAPIEAYENLRRAMVPEGRLAFVCARALDLNPWATLPIEAAERVVGPLPHPKPDGGPFTFADPGRVREILDAAGFERVRLTPIDEPMWVGDDVASAVAAFARTDGRKLLGRVDDATRAHIFDALSGALERYAGPRGVRLPAATWQVTARAPV